MAGPSNDDCYFYYNSICSKGYDCQFRHEPAARATETVCYYWQTAGCTRPHCPYRHHDPAGGLTGRAKQCFWELQPSGCHKYQCPFLHTKLKTEQIASKPVDSGSIIVNKKKLESLQHILPVKPVVEEEEDDTKPRRIVVPPGTGGIARRAVTGGIKNRLGKLGEVKSRLGIRREVTSVLDDSGETDPDIEVLEQELRENAIQSIDLRNRLDAKKPVQEKEVMQLIKVKKPKKHKKDSDKKLKKKKKKLKERNSVRDIISSRLEFNLPSASDYSDLDTPNGSPDPDMITVMSKTSGMYADTKAVGKSAKIRLGKRKIDNDECDNPEIDLKHEKRAKSLVSRVLEELKANQLNELQLKPLRTLEESSPCRNPSPPSRFESPSRDHSCSSPSSRSPSPSPPISPTKASALMQEPAHEKIVTKKKKKEKSKKSKKDKKEDKKKSKKSGKKEKEEKKRRSKKLRDKSPSPSMLKSDEHPDENLSPSKEKKIRLDSTEENKEINEDAVATPGLLDESGSDIIKQLDDLINE